MYITTDRFNHSSSIHVSHTRRILPLLTKIYLRWLDTPGWFFVIFFTRETTFVTSCLMSYTLNSFWKGVCSKRKEFAPLGSKFFPYRVDPFIRREAKQFLKRITSLWSVSILLKYYCRPKYISTTAMHIMYIMYTDIISSALTQCYKPYLPSVFGQTGLNNQCRPRCILQPLTRFYTICTPSAVLDYQQVINWTCSS